MNKRLRRSKPVLAIRVLLARLHVDPPRMRITVEGRDGLRRRRRLIDDLVSQGHIVVVQGKAGGSLTITRVGCFDDDEDDDE